MQSDAAPPSAQLSFWTGGCGTDDDEISFYLINDDFFEQTCQL